MAEKIPRLPDEHLGKAREIIAQNRSKKNCKTCYDRGYLGINQDNMLVPCGKCVDAEAVMQSWRSYVRENAELSALYGDYFAEQEGAEQENSVQAKEGN